MCLGNTYLDINTNRQAEYHNPISLIVTKIQKYLIRNRDIGNIYSVFVHFYSDRRNWWTTTKQLDYHYRWMQLHILWITKKDLRVQDRAMHKGCISIACKKLFMGKRIVTRIFTAIYLRLVAIRAMNRVLKTRITRSWSMTIISYLIFIDKFILLWRMASPFN